REGVHFLQELSCFGLCAPGENLGDGHFAGAGAGEDAVLAAVVGFEESGFVLRRVVGGACWGRPGAAGGEGMWRFVGGGGGAGGGGDGGGGGGGGGAGGGGGFGGGGGGGGGGDAVLGGGVFGGGGGMDLMDRMDLGGRGVGRRIVGEAEAFEETGDPGADWL